MTIYYFYSVNGAHEKGVDLHEQVEKYYCRGTGNYGACCTNPV